MRSTSVLLSMVGIAVAIVTASTASAGIIPVTNPSFEILPAGGLPNPCGTGCSYSTGGGIPGWTGSGDLGQFQPGSVAGNFTYFNYVPDGITVAYSNGGPISQALGAITDAGVTYVLQVDMGFRQDGYPNPGSVALDINGIPVVFAAGVPAQLSGNWVTYTAIYTTTAADIGGLLSIVLDSPGAQGDWDNVRLSSSVPEPGALALIAIALFSLLGLGALRRRRGVD